jgi:hypothetical protein
MKYFRIVVVAAAMATAMAFALASCAVQSAPQKLDDFVDKAEQNSQEYTTEDWAKSTEQYQKLMEEYLKSGREYSEAEKEMAVRAMGRYHALLLKNGVEKSTELIKKLGRMLPEYLDGFAAGLDEGANNLGTTLEGIFNDEKLQDSIDSLGKTLERVFGDLE